MNLILLQVNANKSVEEITKKAEALEKQVADLQETLITAQNSKISSLIGDISIIVGVFGIAFAILLGISAIAVIYIQYANKKAQDNITTAKNLSEEARQLSESGNAINQNAANELQEVQQKIQKVDYLMKFTQKHSLVLAKINKCRVNMEAINHYTDVGTYKIESLTISTAQLLKYLQPYHERNSEMSKQVDECYKDINVIADSFYQYSDDHNMEIFLHNLEKVIFKIKVLDDDYESLLEKLVLFQNRHKNDNSKRKEDNNGT